MNGIKKITDKKEIEIVKEIERRKIMQQVELERIFWLTRPDRKGMFTDICE